MQHSLLSDHGLARLVFNTAAFKSCRTRTAIRCKDLRHAVRATYEEAKGLFQGPDTLEERRSILVCGAALAATAAFAAPAEALGFQKDLTNRRKKKIPESEYKDGPEGLKYYDIEVGNGAEAKEGARVAVHYDAYWKGITFMTSRQGMGVTGGTPIGFDVGAKESGGTLKGLDLGVRGMRVGGQRKLILPPNLVGRVSGMKRLDIWTPKLAYGERGMREIPPNATLTMDVQLLSIKSSPFGYRTKLVEG